MANNENDYSTFVFRTKASPIIKQNLSSNANTNTLINYIRRYIDNNHDILYANGTYALIWRYDGYHGGDDANILYNTSGCSSELVSQIIKESGMLKPSWKVYANNWYWLMVGIIKHYRDTRKQKEMEMIILYLSFSIYATLHYKYYRGYPPNENIMNYTVNNLNNRYDLKKQGNLLGVLYKISTGNHIKYESYLDDKNFCDRRIIEYIMNLVTRLNNFVKEIKIQYQKNKENGKYLNYEQEDTSEENYHEVDNLSFAIERLSNKVTNRIVTSGINHNIANSSAKLAGVSVSIINTTIEKIIEKETEEIREYINLFLQQYLIVDGHPMESFSSKNYLVYVNRIYAKSNTTDKDVIRMKQLLDKWLTENCEKYTQTQRKATLINFRKSIHYYFTLATQAIVNNNY